ncbi:Zinc finger protein 26 [Folsomia candida]|uniref:Zinc finger protein 26 n=1 Tax=Folsomia candida TaxID=158441 RepID=A0A226E1G4_FOLCA|nr:Zinc finger protein 26 [Folsomia candida]
MKMKDEDQLLRNTGAEMEPLVIKSEIEVENDNSGECIRNVLEDDDDEEDDVEDWSQQVMDEVTDEEEDDDDEETDLSRDPLEDVDDYFRNGSAHSNRDGPPQKIGKTGDPAFNKSSSKKLPRPKVTKKIRRNPSKIDPLSICSICGDKGPWAYPKNTLQTHLNCHSIESHKDDERWYSPEKMKCPVTVSCKFVRKSPLLIWEHIMESHITLLHHCPTPSCDEYFILESTLNAHVALHSSTSPVPCPVCDTTFPDGPSLLEHLSSSHSSKKTATMYTCSTCKRAYSSLITLRDHEKRHTNLDDRRKSCEFCSYTCLNAGTMSNHIITKHEGDPTLRKKWRCDLCKKAFVSKVVLRRHVTLHKKFDGTGRTLKCKICEYPFFPGEDGKLQLHLEKIHGDGNDLRLKKCVITGCAFTTSASTHLRQHERKHHPKLLIHKCDSCGKVYSEKILLETHLKTHQEGDGLFGCCLAAHLKIHNGESNLSCDLCPVTFADRGQLRAHKILRHNAPTPHICSICKKKFAKKSYLQEHMDTQHPSETTPTFGCHLCSRVLHSLAQIRAHIRNVHEKPQNIPTCPTCGKKASDMKMHILRAHANADKKAKRSCYFCGKTFIRTEELTTHLSTHTLEKPFICHICSKDYTQGASLGRHFKMHKTNGDFFPKPD